MPLVFKTQKLQEVYGEKQLPPPPPPPPPHLIHSPGPTSFSSFQLIFVFRSSGGFYLKIPPFETSLLLSGLFSPSSQCCPPAPPHTPACSLRGPDLPVLGHPCVALGLSSCQACQSGLTPLQGLASPHKEFYTCCS